jgi:hypothetical protein
VAPVIVLELVMYSRDPAAQLEPVLKAGVPDEVPDIGAVIKQ